MTMENKVETLMTYIHNEDSSSIEKALLSIDASLITHELAIVTLMEGIFEDDIILPRLVVCGIRTISPLHFSALRGADTVLALLLKKTSVDTALSNGSTCLHFACFSGVISSVKMLLDDFSADINKTDSYGWPALHYASIGGQLSVVEELCKRKVHLMLRDKDGTTAAYRAKIFGHHPIVNLFKRLTNNHPNLLEPKDVEDKNEELNSKTQVSKLKMRKDEETRFIQENNYDNPDDLISRIQCKSSLSEQGNKASGSLSEKQIQMGESIYDLPDDKKTTSISSDDFNKESSVKKIQALVESQFKDIFLDDNDPYLQPINSSNSTDGTIDPNQMQNIGFKTLKCLLRSEFQKLRSSYIQPLTATTTTTATTPTTPPTTNSYDEHNIYEEIMKGTLKEKESNWVKGGETIKLGRNQRPRLPPRASMLEKPQQNLSQNDKNSRSSFNTDFSQARQKLNLIEETQIVKEACFNELVFVLESGDWQKLARNLPLRNTKNQVEEKIRKIEKQFPKNTTKQARFALKDWNQYYGKNATLPKLVQALKKSGLVEKIKAVEMASQREFTA